MHRVAVALLLVLAGCGSVPSPGPGDGALTPTGTVTPVPVPADAPAQATLAPGLSPDGVYAPDRLARAHAAQLRDRSFTLVRTDTRSASGAVRQHDRSVLRYAAGGQRFYYDLVQTDYRRGTTRVGRIERYADGERVYDAVTRENRTNYSVLRNDDGTVYAPQRVFPSNATNERGLSRLFVLVNTEVTDRFTVGGTRVYRVATPVPQGLPPLENLTFAANVTEDGLVRDYELAYDVVRSGAPIRVVVTIEYRDIGETTVAPPPWLDDARVATGSSAETTATASVTAPTTLRSFGARRPTAVRGALSSPSSSAGVRP